MAAVSPAIHGTKTCSRCHEEKRALAFAAHPHTRDGLDCWCRDCHNEVNRLHYIKRARRRSDFAMPDGA